MSHNSKNDVIPEARRVESLATDYCRAPAILAFAASDDDGDVLVYGENFLSGFSKILQKNESKRPRVKK